MQIDDGMLIEYVFKGVVGIILGAGAFMWKGLIARVERTERDLSDHKLYSANEFIKKDVVDRIHDRLDKVGERIDEIKTLIINGHNGKN